MTRFNQMFWLVALAAGLFMISPPTLMPLAFDNETTWDDAREYLGGDRACYPAGFPGHDLSTWEEQIENPPIEGTGMSNPNIIPSEPLGDRTYQVPENEPIEAQFQIFNSRPQESVLRLTVLLNTEQLEGVFEDNDQFTIGENDRYVDVALASNQVITIRLNIPPLESGIHDLFILQSHPEDEAPEAQERLFPNMFRYTLVVGDIPVWHIDYNIHAYPPSEPYEYEDREYMSDRGVPPGLHLFEGPILWPWQHPFDPDLLEEVLADPYHTVSDVVEFEVEIGYVQSPSFMEDHGLSPNPQPFALMILINDEQVPIRPGELAHYGMLWPDTLFSRLPAWIDVSDYEEGDYLIKAIAIPYPRLAYCFLSELGAMLYEDFLFAHQYLPIYAWGLRISRPDETNEE